MTTNSPEALSDGELIDAVALAANDERRSTARLVALLAEFDVRRLYLGEDCSSLFTYCTQVLRLSEHAAYHRIEAARTARQFPIIMTLLTSGDVTLTTVAMLRPHLTPANHAQLLDAARHRSKREVEQLIAGLAPRPDAIALIRRLPAVRSAAPVELAATGDPTTEPAPPKAADLCDAVARIGVTGAPPSLDIQGLPLRTAPTPRLAPLSSDRYLLRVTLGAAGHARLRRAQDLCRHSIPNGDPAAIVEKALELLVEHLERAKAVSIPRPRRISTRGKPHRNGRHIPAEVRRTVWARDGGCCAFAGTRGRCTETGQLEFHHLHPFARGGQSTVANIALRCRAHNVFESESRFGAWRPA